MQTTQQYEYRINLLDEYAQTLERENQAKNLQREVIYQQMNTLQEENDFLKGVVNEMKQRLEKKERLRNVSYSLQTSINFNDLCVSHEAQNDQLRYSVRLYDVECQTCDEETQNIEQLREVIRLNEKLREKDLRIENYLRENQEMYEAIEKLEEEISKLQERNHANEERIRKTTECLRNYEKQNNQLKSQLEEMNYRIYNSNEQTQNQKQMYGHQSRHLQTELEKMVKDNNELIERVRMLEKQKNGYYLQLKKAGHAPQNGNENMSSVGNNLPNGKRKAIKGERWSMIQQKIRSIRTQNQKLQTNLVIK